MAVSAPTPLEFKGVEVEYHDAAAQVIVCRVKLVARFVQSYLLDPADDHWRCRRILHTKRGDLGVTGRPDRWRRLTATAGWREKTRDRPGTPFTRRMNRRTRCLWPGAPRRSLRR